MFWLYINCLKTNIKYFRGTRTTQQNLVIQLIAFYWPTTVPTHEYPAYSFVNWMICKIFSLNPFSSCSILDSTVSILLHLNNKLNRYLPVIFIVVIMWKFQSILVNSFILEFKISASSLFRTRDFNLMCWRYSRNEYQFNFGWQPVVILSWVWKHTCGDVSSNCECVRKEVSQKLNDRRFFNDKYSIILIISWCSTDESTVKRKPVGGFSNLLGDSS